MRLSSPVIIALLFSLVRANADEVRRLPVKYVSSSAIYIDGGSREGLKVGQTGDVYRGEILIGMIEVVYLSEKSASCRSIDSTGVIAVGDMAQFVIVTGERPPLIGSIDETAEPPTTTLKQAVKPAKKARKFRGRAVVSYYTQDDLSDFDYDYSQPSLYFQGNVFDWFQSGTTISLRVRLRQVERVRGLGTQWENRFYEVSAKKEFTDRKLTLHIGRFAFSESPGVGYIDGLAGEKRHTSSFSYGGFVGMEPGNSGEVFQSNRLKIGAFGRFQVGDWTTSKRLNTVMALTGGYRNGVMEREFLYLSNDATIVKGLNLYQSSELEFNRGWRRNVEGDPVKLSSLYFGLNWEPVRSVNVTAGYDNRLPIRDYEARSTPDSLFDSEVRQGFHGGVSFRLPHALRVGFDAGSNGVRNGSSSTNGSGYISGSKLFATGIAWTFRSGAYKSGNSNGSQISASLSRDVLRILNLRIDAGEMQQKWIAGGSGSGKTGWLRTIAEVTFSRSGFGSISYEVQRGDYGKANRISADFGVRF